MIYVLIVVSYFSGAGGNGQTVTFQEFNTQEACHLALKVVEEKKKPGYAWDNYKLTCVPKGETK
jgi:predicted DNA-binding WGR domain protein